MSDDKDLYKDDLYGGGSMSIIPRLTLSPSSPRHPRVTRVRPLHPLTSLSDLDLEDIDASALEEELVEPPEFDQPPASAPVSQSLGHPAAAAPASAVPAPAQPGGGQSFQYGAGALDGQAGGSGGQHGADDSGVDRIRPSDMPDEGLVWCGSSYSQGFRYGGPSRALSPRVAPG
jgi:hypothetical protein